MSKFSKVTDSQIRRLRTEAFAAGDILQGNICHLALCDEHSAEDLTSGSWLNDNTPLNFDECREMENITQADARRICERVIGTAQARA